jgi:hypothetical protein
MSPTARSLACLVLLLLAVPASTVSAEEGAPGDPVEAALRSPQATGLLVKVVAPETQAAQLGILPGDVLVVYDGHPTPSIDALRAAMQAVSTETLDVLVVRLDGTEKTFTLEPGRIGVELAPVVKGKGVEPLPPATEVTFDFAALADAPHDDWYDFTIDGKHAGFEHGLAKLEDGRVVMRREVAFDGGEAWGVNHFDVTVVMTADALPKLVSLSFENPVAGYVGAGAPSTAEGKPVLRYEQSAGDESTTVDHPIPGDLPAISEYVIETLACFMPREQGACLHYRPVADMTGAIGLPAALLVLGEEEVQIGDAQVKAWKMQVHKLGSGPGTAFWVGAAGRVVKADYLGAVTTAAPKADCLKDLHHGLQPRTAD